MTPWFGAAWRRKRIERQAHDWVVRIHEDRKRHAAGLRRWVGHDQARADIYNAAWRAWQDSRGPAETLFGGQRERSSWTPLPSTPMSRLHMGLAIGFSLLAAGGGLVLGLGILDGRSHNLLGPPGTAKPYMIATRLGEIRTVKLADGSQVVLDTDSMLRVTFSRTARSVQLQRGRARFDVAHNKAWPFVVLAGGGTITARGTMFDVAVYRTVRVHLFSGRIDVRYPQTPRRASAVQHLTAGQQVRYDPAMSKDPAPPSQGKPTDAQWVSGMRTFDEVPVDDIIEEANGYSSRKIVLADPEIGKRDAFLDLDPRNTRDVALNLARYLGLRVDENRSDIIKLVAPR